MSKLKPDEYQPEALSGILVTYLKKTDGRPSGVIVHAPHFTPNAINVLSMEEARELYYELGEVIAIEESGNNPAANRWLIGSLFLCVVILIASIARAAIFSLVFAS